MPSRQPSRPTHGLIAIATVAAPHRGSWMRRLRLALIPFALVLLVAYLAVLALSLFDPQLIGASLPSSGARWPDALGYPLAVAGALSPAWLVGVAVVLVVVYGLCVFAVREQPAIQAVQGGSAGVGARHASPGRQPAGEQPAVETAPEWPAAAKSAYADSDQAKDGAVGARPVSPVDVSNKQSADDTVGASGGRPPVAPAADSPLPTQLTASPAATLRVFISHSSANNDFGLELVRRIQQELGAAGDAWYDKSGSPESEYESGLLGGDRWWARIVHEITERNVFVVLLSPEAMASHWVHDEIDLAWKQQNASGQQRRKVIIPVLCSPCEMPETLSLVQVVSFLPGRSYEGALAELMAAIRLGHTRQVQQPTVEAGPPFDLAQLPLPAHFVGREQELAFLRERLTQRGSMSSIVAAINGLGGIGKTGLAARVIRDLRDEARFPDGIAVALCQGKKSEADALQILADVLTRFDPQRRAPEANDYAGLADTALRLLKGKETLVVLDNVEPELPVQLVVTPLREAGASLLLTARQQQTADIVPPERRLRLDLLSEEEALDLLAKSLGRPAALDLTHSELEAARRIVANLDRHTLAVTLAAAYVADEVGPTLEQLAEQLADPQRALKLPKGEAPDEVKRVFASSYDALPAEAQRLFAALAAFPTAEFGREASVALAKSLDIADPERTVELLVRRALVTVQGARLRLHPLIQALAASEFAEWPPQQREETERSVADYYANYAMANFTEFAVLAPDEANIVGTVEWAQAHDENRLLARLCNGISYFWKVTGRTFMALRYLPDGIAAAQRLTATTSQLDDQEQVARLQTDYAGVLLISGRIDEAQRYLEESLRIHREVGDHRHEGITLNDLGIWAHTRGRLDEAQRYLEESLRIHREVGNRRDEGMTLVNLGQVAIDRGQLDEAQRYLEESLHLRREASERAGEGITLTKLAILALARSQLDEAQGHLEESLRIAREVGNRRDEGEALGILGQVAVARGQSDEARRYLGESLRIAREVGNRFGEAATLAWFGQIAREQGRLDEAQRYLEEGLRIRREVRGHRIEWMMLDELGQLAQARGQLDEAQRYYEESLRTAREMGNRQGEGVVLDDLAGLAHARNQLDEAQRLYEESLAIAREVDDRAGQGVILSNMSITARVRGQLDEAQGYLEESLRIAREVRDRVDEGEVLHNMALVAHARRQLAEAQRLYEESLAIARETQDADLEETARENLEAVIAERRAAGEL